MIDKKENMMIRNIQELYNSMDTNSINEKTECIDAIMRQYIMECRSCRDFIIKFREDYKDTSADTVINVANLLASMPNPAVIEKCV